MAVPRQRPTQCGTWLYLTGYDRRNGASSHPGKRRSASAEAGAEQLTHHRDGLVDVALPTGDDVGIEEALADPDDHVGQGRAVDGERQPAGVDLLGQQPFDDADRTGLDAGGL